MKTVVHVDQHVIRANIKREETEPPLTVRTYKGVRKAHEVIVMHQGVEVGRFVYRPHQPLSCGARLWFETHGDVELVTSCSSQLAG